MGNPFGRATIVPLTNKSGGAIAAGDLVYIDTANNDSFTTGTTSGYTKGIGIAQAAIASNAIGLVLIDGYASLVNVNASVTRGNFLKGHSVVKQGTDAGSSRGAGTCGMFLTGGTTPDAIIWQPDLGAGSGLTDPMTTRGDTIYRNSSNTTDRLAIPAAGQVLGRSGSDLGAIYPPGYQLDYVEATSPVSVTHTSEATADVVLTSNAVTFDGTACWFEFGCSDAQPDSTAAGRQLFILLFDNTASASASIGRMALLINPSAATFRLPVTAKRKLTPSAGSRTYSVRAIVNAGTGSVNAGAGATSDYMPMWFRIVKV